MATISSERFAQLWDLYMEQVVTTLLFLDGRYGKRLDALTSTHAIGLIPHTAYMLLHAASWMMVVCVGMAMCAHLQFDALNEKLTAYELLTMYARLRGIPERRISSIVDEAVKRLNLTKWADRQCGTYRYVFVVLSSLLSLCAVWTSGVMGNLPESSLYLFSFYLELVGPRWLPNMYFEVLYSTAKLQFKKPTSGIIYFDHFGHLRYTEYFWCYIFPAGDWQSWVLVCLGSVLTWCASRSDLSRQAAMMHLGCWLLCLAEMCVSIVLSLLLLV